MRPMVAQMAQTSFAPPWRSGPGTPSRLDCASEKPAADADEAAILGRWTWPNDSAICSAKANSAAHAPTRRLTLTQLICVVTATKQM